MIRVALADDHRIVREGIKAILSEKPDLEVVVESEDSHDLVALCREWAVDVLVLDVDMPGPGFLEVLSQFAEELPSVPVLILTVKSEKFFAMRALRAGAAGFLTKELTPDELAVAIRKLHRGERYLTSSLAEQLVLGTAVTSGQPSHQSLSEREFQVLLRLVEGRSHKHIGRALEISPKTVSTYRSRILDKLGLSSNAELVRYAIDTGLTE